MQRAAEEVGMAAFDAICSAQKDRRLGASDLTLPYPTLPYLRKVRTRVQFGVPRTTHYGGPHCVVRVSLWK